MRTSVIAAFAVVALMACDAQEATPAPAKPAPAAPAAAPAAPATAPPPPAKAPAASPNEVDLTFEGGFTATLRGKGGLCAPGLGANFEVRSEELGVAPAFKLNILVTAEDEWANPAITLNVDAPRGSWARDRRTPPAGESIALARDHTEATIDTTLRAIPSGEPVKVKGSIRCPKGA
ncbi:hypothetical protein [Nannocystis pusilla]|uniref:Lipoprotein n=1 Tax=Nannocystis pusilla TaxID=889268 RepID=A0ABS7TRU1_9BACT|nr:hypothetical protein [Nannocystis pusilla]MBZ5710776.1 hypothetical protein [Nannocystis pusilla]